MPKILRITTVPISLKVLLQGQFRFLQEMGWEVLTVSAAGPEVKEIQEIEGVKHIAIPLTRTISPFTDLVALWKLIQTIKNFKPDIIHSHTPKAGLIGMLAAWLCKVPNRLHTVAGLPLIEYTGWKRILLNQTEKLTYRLATKVYPNSNQLSKFIQDNLHKSPDKFKVIGQGSSNGIDTDYFKPSIEIKSQALQIKKDLQIPENAFTFLFIGRLVKDKGIVELIHAFEALIKIHNIYLIMVGPFEQELDPLPEDILLTITNHTNIKLSGFQKDVRPYLASANGFVFPSYREGFPNVLMQAACMEVPIIASNINGCNEIIQHGERGLLIETKNIKDLVNAMQELITNQTLGDKFKINAAQFVRKNFDRNHFWSLLLAEYESQLK